jgi:1A family penicillin-binding protein
MPSLQKELTEFRSHPEKRVGILKTILNELWLIAKKPLLYIFLGGIVLMILIPIATYLYFIRDLGSKERILNHNNHGLTLLDRNGKQFFTFYEPKNNDVISFSNIPKTVDNAVVAIEDRDFQNHPGVSVSAVARAAIADITHESITQGGSTITQQLIKNTLLSPEQTFLRKYQEAILALEVERRFSKDDILEMYLNSVYFGEGAFGIEDAAKTYFNKEASDLDLAESALLAGILPAPSAYSPISGDREKAFLRQRLVLSEMQKQGYITKEEEEKAVSEDIIFNTEHKDVSVKAPHFALMVKDELIKKYGEQTVARSGYTVTTTLSLADQLFAETTVKNQIARLKYNHATNGALVAMDPGTGEILALVGSHDWFDDNNGKINMALAPRQPGSSFKPIIYAAGISQKVITAATELDDKPITFAGGYKPKNYDGKFRDHVLVRFALANSLNIPSLHVMERVGVANGISFAKKLGITSINPNQDYGLPLVLGDANVPLLQMTDAYSVFAGAGYLTKPTTIINVKDKNGKVIFTNTPSRIFVLDSGTSFIISSILSDNAIRAETFGNALTISRPAAVKTGTTEDYRDALTIGYTPNLVIGVWVGNNDNTPMDSIAGSLGAAPIWRQVMQQFFKTIKEEPFVKPFSIDSQKVCRENGKKATIATSSAYLEYFLPSTIPTEDCNGPALSPTEIITPTAEEFPTDAPTSSPFPTLTPSANTQNPSPTSQANDNAIELLGVTLVPQQ